MELFSFKEHPMLSDKERCTVHPQILFSSICQEFGWVIGAECRKEMVGSTQHKPLPTSNVCPARLGQGCFPRMGSGGREKTSQPSQPPTERRHLRASLRGLCHCATGTVGAQKSLLNYTELGKNVSQWKDFSLLLLELKN